MTDALDELRDLLTDKDWRLGNLYMILDEDGNAIPFRPRGEQIRFLANRHNRNFVPKARKLGLSTVIVLDNLDFCIFRPDSRVGIIDITDDDSKDKLSIAKFAWERGPEHPDPRIAAIWRYLHQANERVTDSKGAMEWANGSVMSAGVRYTGKTPQRLHVSEFGPISAQSPLKAADISRGSFNSVPRDGIIDVETTMQGNQYGACFKIFKAAIANEGQEITALDWKLHFFSWLNHPTYRIPNRVPYNESVISYFQGLKAKHGLDVSLDRQAWYERKKAEQGEDIYQQFPTIIEECDRLIVPGQIYPEMKTLRMQGRVCKFNPEKGLPLYTAWDLGSSDNSAGWLVQPAGKAHNFLSWSSGEGEGAAGVASVIREWEAIYGKILAHLVPHDAQITDKGSGKTYLSQLVECGIPRGKIIVVPRIPDLWVGVCEVRKLLNNAWFHSDCDKPIETIDGVTLPSGVQRLEGYRKRVDQSTGICRDIPVHDICSHLCVSAGTMVLMSDMTQKAIECIQPGEMVWTPVGPCDVTHVHDNGIGTVTSIDDLWLTPKHKIFSIENLVESDTISIYTEVWKFNRLKSNIKGVHTHEKRIVLTTQLGQGIKNLTIYIGKFLSIISDQFQKGFTSTISTGTHLIMIPLTLNQYPRQSISDVTQKRMPGLVQKKIKINLSRLKSWPRFGTDRKTVENGTENTELRHGRIAMWFQKTANAVANCLKQGLTIKSFVKEFANKDLQIIQYYRLIKNAPAERYLQIRQKPKTRNTVLRVVTRRLRMKLKKTDLQKIEILSGLLYSRAANAGQILSAEKEGLMSSIAQNLVAERVIIGNQEKKVRVYDLTINEAHCYVANGILVSNCDAARTLAEGVSRGLLDAMPDNLAGRVTVASGFRGLQR